MLLFPPRPEDFKFAEAKSPRLRIITYSDAARTIIVSGLTRSGLINDAYTTDNTCDAQERIIYLTEIPLTIQLSTTTQTTQRGQLYALITLEIANAPVITLTSDYITSANPLSYPTGSIQQPTQGNGAILLIDIGNPAVGAEWIFTNTKNLLLRIISVNYSLETNATVATRRSSIDFFLASGEVDLVSPPATTQLTSLSRSYYWSNISPPASAFLTYIFGTLPNAPITKNGSVRSFTENKQVGDVYTSVFLTVEQWINP